MVAELYDRTRPPYPAGLVDRIVASAPGRAVLDVGCGTGIAARQFQVAGCTVLGVEPDERMAAVARRRGLPVEISTFEAWDPAGRRFDAVVSGTAWHWVDPGAGATRAAEVLRQDGRLAVFWQTPELPPRIGTAFADAYRRVAPDSPISLPASSGADAYAPLFQKAADGIRAVGGFCEPEEWRFDWEQRCTRDQLLDQLRTSGAVTRLPGGALAEILGHVGAAVDALGGRVAVRYATVTVTATRR